MDDSEIERKPILQADEVLPSEPDKLETVEMPDMFTDGDQGPINQVILSNIGPVTDDHGALIDGSVSGTFVADASTLQNLIASGTVQLTDAAGQPLQLVRLGSSEQTTSTSQPSAISQVVVKGENNKAGEGTDSVDGIMAHLDVSLPVSSALSYGVLSAPSNAVQNLPPGTPVWAARLKDCQKIGDFYRGWVETEVELDIILTLHKQHTQTMWGTRQSPCPNKPATRLMWKSQYVPFDGIPFLNAGSRAIVMECQFGPRRKGSQSRKDEMAPLKSDFKQTCPARIYIKKVKKFTNFQIPITNDKKAMKVDMDRAFQLIREKEFKYPTQERYYVQLPTLKAHEFHGDKQEEVLKAVITGTPATTTDDPASRLHPMVVDKIREFVSMGETRLYVIRKQLRKFVEKELFEVPDNIPDKHNLQFFPTVNDLQNHIHQAARDIEAGVLPMAANTLNLDMMETQERGSVWQVSDNPHAETVTVTLTQNSEGDNAVISKVETHLSDGSTQVSDNLNPETARLLAKVHPNVFSSVTQSLQEQSSLSIQVPVSASESVPLSLPSGTSLLASPLPEQQPVAPSLQDTDDHSAYTVLQDSNGAFFLTKVGVIGGTEEECSTNNILSESSLSIPQTSGLREIENAGALTIVENDISQPDTDSGLTGIRGLVGNDHEVSLELSQTDESHPVTDTLNGECNFTIVSGSSFPPTIQDSVVGDYRSECAINGSSDLDVGHLTEGANILVSEEVGVITQEEENKSNYGQVLVKQEHRGTEVTL